MSVISQVWNGITAAATAASAIFIAVQVRQTKRAALSAASTLDLAQKSLEVSRHASLETTKSRLDQRAGRLTINCIYKIAMPLAGSNHGEPQPFTREIVFRLPKDANVEIALAATFAITNDGATAVHVDLGSGFYTPNNRSKSGQIEHITIAAGATESVTLQGGYPVSMWIANWEAASRGGQPHLPTRVTGQVIHNDGFDDGVFSR